MSLLLGLFSALAVLAGAFFFLAGTVGLLRFPDTLSRIHALTKADNLGLGLIVLGLLPLAAGLGEAMKLILVWALVLVSGATAAQLVAGAVRRREDGEEPR
ncbi:MAG: monovalent cation/H(+) antiporter subunit G [Rubritepida sp.]|jgi:multicomponent Na+:H+ antiporter subunit G|nr:monovalent cation/H(+) antiporter subunit G [Rubritepida sp.]MCU0944611.1 monovalent cation/H(+) antiporter subunit G [Rubritepida sp.]